MSRAPIWLALLVLLIYARALGGGPVYDDENLMVNNTRIVMSGVRQAFTTDFWGEPPEGWRHVHYRPLATLAYSGIYHLFGLSPFAFHAASILMHALATVALFYLARALGLGTGVAAVAAGLFAVHPLNVEAVAWMSGLSEVMSGATVLGSLALFAHRRRLSLLAAAVAMLTKEMALALPVLIFLLAEWGGGGARRWRTSLRAAAPYAVLGIAYVVLRMMVVPPPPPHRLMQALLEGSSIMTGSAAHYLRVLFVPWPLAIHYTQPGLAGKIAGAAMAALWIALAWRLRDEENGLFVAAGLGSIPLLIPVVHATIMIEVLQMPDRNVYMAVAGAALTLALLLDRLPKPGMLYGSLLMLALGAVLTVRQVGVWKDAESLWTHTLYVTPASKPAALNLGFLYFVEGRYQDAARVYRYALLYHPNDGEFLKRLADVAGR